MKTVAKTTGSGKTLQQALEFHPLANLFPLLEGTEAEALGADIAANGQHEPIWLYRDQILDGRNRYLQCLRLGIEPVFRDFEGGDPLKFVISLNLRRRHLNESQRAWVAAKIATVTHGGDRKSDQAANLPLDQAAAATMLNVSPRSVRSATAVRDHGAPELQHAVEHGHLPVSAAAQAANLPAVQQREIAVKATAGDANAARNVIKQARRAQREAELGAKICALPDRRYGVILADPEWKFEVWSEAGEDRSARNHYPTSAIEAIKTRDIASIAADDAVLLLWATVPLLPQALEVLVAWGFVYRSHFIWAKDRAGTGYWNRNRHELLLIGTRGNIVAPAMGTQLDSLVQAPVGAHSAKPEIFLKMIESYFPSLPKIELNRRGPARPGWSAWGNEVVES